MHARILVLYGCAVKYRHFNDAPPSKVKEGVNVCLRIGTYQMILERARESVRVITAHHLTCPNGQ